MGFKMTQFFQEALLRKREVLRLTGLSNSTFYSRIQARIIKPGVPMGPRLKGWPASEIDAYIKSCIAARDTQHGDSK
jgi:predicted DNA-binding transcriptional regulator AlpA